MRLYLWSRLPSHTSEMMKLEKNLLTNFITWALYFQALQLYQGDRVADRCAHSQASEDVHRCSHRNEALARDQTWDPPPFHSNTGNGWGTDAGCTLAYTWDCKNVEKIQYLHDHRENTTIYICAWQLKHYNYRNIVYLSVCPNIHLLQGWCGSNFHCWLKTIISCVVPLWLILNVVCLTSYWLASRLCSNLQTDNLSVFDRHGRRKFLHNISYMNEVPLSFLVKVKNKEILCAQLQY